MISYPFFVIADRPVSSAWKRWQRILVVVEIGGLVMTAWDVIMYLIIVAGDNGCGM
jgi:hypothetical protein